MQNRKPHNPSNQYQLLRASMTEWAIETVKRLPKHCTTTQEKKRLMGIIKLNQMLSKAYEMLHERQAA